MDKERERPAIQHKTKQITRMKHIIIGGVAGGATAAARIRRADEKAEIILIEKGRYISYANCGLPYYIGGVIKDRDKLFVQTPEAFSRRFNVDVRTESEAVAIDTAARTVEVRSADGSTYSEGYDRLLLSPGSSPVKPPLPGIGLDGIFTLRNVDDTDDIKEYIETHNVRNAVVVGGGFIGLEMAENLHHAGAAVSIVEMAGQVMAPVDFSIASHVHRHLMDKGVGLYLNRGVEKFEKAGERIAVCFGGGGSITADIVILSIGVRPNTELAKAAGIEIGQRGIKVDSHLETSAKGVYAVGDAVEYPHPETGQPWLNYLAGPANRQGRIVADNMVFGNTTEYEGAIGTSIAKVFDITVGATGLPAKRLKQEGVPYASSTTWTAAHAGYYPGAFMLTTKLTFDPATGKLLGAQCVGREGVDKRIDQLALVIKHGGTVEDLTKIEHAYAPPFSSAKDPVAIAGYTACNIKDGKMPVAYWREIGSGTDGSLLLDVRTEEEYELGTIPGAVNIPLDDLRGRIGELPRDKEIVIFCAVGLRGYIAMNILRGNGFSKVRNLSGGYNSWKLATQEITQAAQPCQSGGTCGCPPCMGEVVKVDACGLQCPGPIMQLKKAVDKVSEGGRIEIVATDAGFPRDAGAWCASTGNKLVHIGESGGLHTVVVEKGCGKDGGETAGGTGKTLIMFSDDLDKAIATFVLANGAAATGGKVSIFFTFWGLNVIKKEKKPAVAKDFFGKMFSAMLPSSSSKLGLSKLNMLGAGAKMIRRLMAGKKVYSLEEMISQARENGVEFIACQMSMDLMGVAKEELLDGVTIGGVATYMERAGKANVNLFI